MKLSWIRKDQWVSKYEVKLNKKGSMSKCDTGS